jgi:hypothetical protein
MLDGLRQPAIFVSGVEKPVAVCAQPAGTSPPARGILTPSAYNWRVSRLAGTFALHRPGVPAALQPLTGTPPLIVGVCPAAATQRTLCPLRPESAVVKFSGAFRP